MRVTPFLLHTSNPVNLCNKSLIFTSVCEKHGGILLHAVGTSSKAKSVKNSNTDLVFKAKHHSNNRKDTPAESTKSKYFMFVFLQAAGGRG